MLVWDRYIGLHFGSCKCFCCKTMTIYQIMFECGHVVAEKNGGLTNIDNLRPVCSTCNKSMGTKNMVDFSITLM